jgi:glycosyltransferase involved in cell wall biosynthesis
VPEIRVTHIIAGLLTGGAEMMLYKVLSRWDRSRFRARVISLSQSGFIADRIQGLGVPVHTLGMSINRPDPRPFLRLARWLRIDPPDVVQTWMYHADLVGGLTARLVSDAPILWGIRTGPLEDRSFKRSTLMVIQTCARLSRLLPTRILCCSEAGRREHEALGYDHDKMVVVPNGFDLEAFRPDPEARAALRGELGISDETPLIGMVARYDPVKDHATFFEAAARLHAVMPEARFVLCGRDVTWENRAMASMIDRAGVRQVVHLLGQREDAHRVIAALDVSTLSSACGEGFSNVIGESMACAVPCVVTDVGDAAQILGDTGLVVPPRRPETLAAGWRRMAELPAEARAERGRAARERVESRFSLDVIVRRYQDLYVELNDVRNRRAS